MLNREDIRKVIEAYEKVKHNFKDKEEISMREMQEVILKEIKDQEESKK